MCFWCGYCNKEFLGSSLGSKVSMVLRGDIDAKRAEAIAVKEGLLLAWELGFHLIILKGDAKNVFTNFKDWNSDLSYSGAILVDAMYIASWFSYFKACFVPRHCNQVVDHLASLARFLDS